MATIADMELAAFQTLSTQVLWAVFAAAFAFGIITQRTHFCTMGAISDVVNMSDWTRARQWAMAVGVAMILFYLMAGLSLIDPHQTIYTATRVIWLSALVGGALFGSGMVLASGCGSKTLVRIGSGNLKSLVVFVVMGIAAFATLRGMTAVWRTQTVDTMTFDMSTSSAIPLWLSAQMGWGLTGTVAVAFSVGVALVVWAIVNADFRSESNNWIAGVGVGVAVAALWWISGHMAFVDEHPLTLESVYVTSNTGLMESFTFIAPVSYVIDWVMFYSDASKVLTLGVVSVFGVIAGAFAYAVATQTFHWEGFRSTQDTALHLVGAVLMGVGGVTAMGCTVGQGLSGLSTLSLTSLLAVLGIVLGALVGLRFQMWLIERE